MRNTLRIGAIRQLWFINEYYIWSDPSCLNKCRRSQCLAQATRPSRKWA